MAKTLKYLLILVIVAYAALYNQLLYLLALIPVVIQFITVSWAKQEVRNTPLKLKLEKSNQLENNGFIITIFTISRLTLLATGGYIAYLFIQPYIGMMAQ